MRVFGASTRGCEMLLGLLTIVGALSVYDFFLNDCRWNDPVLLLIGSSALGMVFCLYQIVGGSALLSYFSQVAARIRGSIFGVLAVAAPLAGWLGGNLYSRRPHGYESGEQHLGHLFEYAGIFCLGIGVAAVLALIAFFRRERGRWLAVLGIIIEWPLSNYLNHVVFW